MIEILFSRNHLPFSYAIRAITWSDYSHVDLITKEAGLIGAMAQGGVRKYDFQKRLDKSSAAAIMTIEEADYDLAIQFAKSQIGKPYDWAGVFGLWFHRDWEDTENWWCSELVAAALSAGGFKPFSNSAMNRITPQHLLMLNCTTRRIK